METNIVVISPPIPYLANFCYWPNFELLAKMLSANQITGLFKM